MEPMISQEEGRTVYRYAVPAGRQDDVEGVGKVQVIALVMLRGEDEVLAAQRGRGNQFRTAYESAKASLWRLNDTRVSLSTNADHLWNVMPGPMRGLILAAHAQIHHATQEEVADFLSSQQIIAG